MILHTAARGGAGGPALVLLHGLFGRAANFGAVMSRLAASGRRVLALDLRNHGASPHADTMDYPAMAADVAETLDAVGALPCRLVGHSMGGKVAMALALTDPRAIERLVVVDIAPVRYPSNFGNNAAAMRALPLPPGLTRTTADAALAPDVPDPRIRGFLLQNLRVGGDPAWTIGLDAITAALPVVEGWPGLDGRYDGPTLFLRGERSDYVTDAAWPLIRRLFPAATAKTLPTGHWVHAEDPEGFVAAVDAFMS